MGNRILLTSVLNEITEFLAYIYERKRANNVRGRCEELFLFKNNAFCQLLYFFKVFRIVLVILIVHYCMRCKRIKTHSSAILKETILEV